MPQIKVLSIFGTRPEAVKMAPVVQMLNKSPGIISRVCVTAQHREMLDQVLNLFAIKPDIDLDLMRPNQSLAELTAQIFTNLDPVLISEQPDWVLVQGDTTTVMAASLAAFYRGIKVGHVEAGLRTGNRKQPFPEEINRKIASVTADLHFAPTALNRKNLLNEGIPAWRILITGNPVIDALQQIANSPEPDLVKESLAKWNVGKSKNKLIVVTAHRRENFGKPIEDICQALKTLADGNKELQIMYPVHLNPNIQEPVNRILSNIPNIHLLPPLEYLPLIHFIRSAYLVLTDSGGIQEEATGLGKPTLVLRDATERPEGIDAGVLKLVGTNSDSIVRETRQLLDDPRAYSVMAHSANPFGDGHAAGRIVAGLLNFKEQ